MQPDSLQQDENLQPRGEEDIRESRHRKPGIGIFGRQAHLGDFVPNSRSGFEGRVILDEPEIANHAPLLPL